MSSIQATEAPPDDRLDPSKGRAEVIAEFLPIYIETCERLKGRHGDGFKHHLTGEIPGLRGPHEERALAWLRVEVAQNTHAKRIQVALNSGWVDAEDLTTEQREQRHELVALVGRGKDCDHPSRSLGVGIDSATEWIEIPDALIRFDPAHGTPITVVPKGSRVNGTKVVPLRVLVKRAAPAEASLALFTPAAD